MKRAFFVVAAFVAMTISTAFSGASQPQTHIDSLSYAVGADIGLNINFGIKDLNLDKVVIIENVKDFLANGDVESEEFMQEMQQLQTFMYTKFMPYMQALEDESHDPDALPELYDEEFKREDIARYIGHSMAAGIKSAELELNMSFFNEGLNDALKVESEENINEGLRLTLDEMEQVFAAQEAKDKAKAEAKLNENIEANAKWLSYVEQWHGVNKTESGLLYRIDRKGYGKKPTLDSDVVTVHYEGKLRTGEIFDSSYERGEPISFALNVVIKGWTEGMKYIAEGGQITLWIPAELAYGNDDRGAIKAGDALEFTIELLEVNPRR